VDLDRLATLPSVISARCERGGYLLTVGEPHVAIPEILGQLGEWRYHLNRLTTRHASLEDVFVSLTGRHLEDEGEHPGAATTAAATGADETASAAESTPTP
jgi:ABC-2 type transport system ATP-binding protein